MLGPFRKTGLRGALTLAAGGLGIAAAGFGCRPSATVAPGAPLLLSFSILALPADDGSRAVLPPDATGVVPMVPPQAIFAAIFDRLLDPGAIEVADPDGGALTSEVGVVTLASTPAVDPAKLIANYIPNGVLPAENGPQVPDGGGPAIIPALPPGPEVIITPSAALPCATTLTITLSGDKLRSHDQKLAFQPSDGVPSELTFVTDAFTATIDVPMVSADGGSAATATTPTDTTADGGDADGGDAAPPVAPLDGVAHVKFNTLVSADTAAHIHVTVTEGGLVVPDLGTPARDTADPSIWDVAPPAAGWPPGATVDIAVDVGAVDGYGIALAQPATASFQVVTP